MKLIIAGSRTINLPPEMINELVIITKIKPTLVISGGAAGIDKSGEAYAKMLGIPLKVILPDWKMFGKQAGFVRNHRMLDIAQACLVIWDGVSAGSIHMATISRNVKKIPTYVWHYGKKKFIKLEETRV